jgi:hypothetical protein
VTEHRFSPVTGHCYGCGQEESDAAPACQPAYGKDVAYAEPPEVLAMMRDEGLSFGEAVERWARGNGWL